MLLLLRVTVSKTKHLLGCMDTQHTLDVDSCLVDASPIAYFTVTAACGNNIFTCFVFNIKCRDGVLLLSFGRVVVPSLSLASVGCHCEVYISYSANTCFVIGADYDSYHGEIQINTGMN